MTLLACCDCGCTDIQQTSWTMVNTRIHIGGKCYTRCGEVLDEEGPTEQVWCPRCDDDVGGWVDVEAPDPYEHETKRIDGTKFLMSILDDLLDDLQSENSMNSGQQGRSLLLRGQARQ